VTAANIDSARSGLSKLAPVTVAAASFSFAGGLYGWTFIFLTPTPGPRWPGGTLGQVGLALRRLGLATALEVGLLDAAKWLELTEHLKTAEISLGDTARLRRMAALTRRAHAAGDPTESPEM
jgi:hypothetical protein